MIARLARKRRQKRIDRLAFGFKTKSPHPEKCGLFISGREITEKETRHHLSVTIG